MTRCRSLAIVCLATLLAFSAQPLNSQGGLRFSVAGGGYYNSISIQDDGENQSLSGFSGGGEGSVAIGRLGLGLRYLEGSVSPSGSGTGADVVEGEAILSFRALQWLALKFGPRLRSTITSGVTERWVFWEGRVGTRARLGSPRVVGNLEFLLMLSGDVNTSESFNGGQGLRGRLSWELSELPLWIGLGYHIDRIKSRGGLRTEATEQLVLLIGIGRGARY